MADLIKHSGQVFRFTVYRSHPPPFISIPLDSALVILSLQTRTRLSPFSSSCDGEFKILARCQLVLQAVFSLDLADRAISLSHSFPQKKKRDRIWLHLDAKYRSGKIIHLKATAEFSGWFWTSCSHYNPLSGGCFLHEPFRSSKAPTSARCCLSCPAQNINSRTNFNKRGCVIYSVERLSPSLKQFDIALILSVKAM